MKRVTIVGLGLIGGSIAKALHRTGTIELVGVDRSEVGQRDDVKATLTEFVSSEDVSARRDTLLDGDLVILCQPVQVIADSVGSYLSARTVVTDTGSTKRLIAAGAAHSDYQSWFVPGHPMAGKAKGGFENAAADLFVGRPWILCPQDRDPEAVKRVEALLELVGAQRVIMTPEEHDASVAITSHLPQLLSSWLRLAACQRKALLAAGPAFVEMTRTAGGAEAIWRDIYASNADEVGQLARDAALALAAISDALLARPPRIDAVLELLAKARNTQNG